MIPFASQRGGGQDLATHLMNAHENEQVTLFEVRGAVARDLHGAFAEWEAIAGALTRCRQYLCSLSVNPDERHGRFTRDQYLDYIARTETALGLAGQPRAIIFHIKQDEQGRAREHCHVVWSRIDVEKKRAVPLSFFKEKLMAATRAFARDHGLVLPPGYDRQEDAQRRNRQLSSYDCIKQRQTGITHEERMAAVTDAWRRSDSGRAFVRALAELGYILAQGRNGTRVVLVDFYGHTTALTRLIDDPAVRAKHVREFLGPDYAPDKLPSVDEAQAAAAQRRKLIEAFETAQAETDEREALIRQQQMRRQALEGEAAALRQRQHKARVQLAAAQKEARHELKSAYLAEQKRIRLERVRRRPKGLAAFLGRVTGIELVAKKVQRRRDRKRYGAYLSLHVALKQRQQEQRDALTRGHELQAADLRRRLRALDQIEERERKTLETTALKERRQAINARHMHMPAVPPVPTRPEQTALSSGLASAPDTALARQMAEAAQLLKETPTPVRLSAAFARATDTEDGDGESGDTGTAEPSRKCRRDRKRSGACARSKLRRDFRQASSGDQGEGEADGESSKAPKPAANPPPKHRRRRKRKARNDPAAEDGRRHQVGEERVEKDEAEREERQRRRQLRRDFKPGK